MNRFSPSELILNADGSIYHLNLHPEDIANTIITVGDPNRVERISQYFDRVEVKKEKREFRTHTGYIGHQRLSVLSTGIGSGNIDIFMNELDALVNVDFKNRCLRETTRSIRIVRIGTSGSIHPTIRPDDFLVSRAAIGLDATLSFYSHQKLAAFDRFLDQSTGNSIPHHFAEADADLLSIVSDEFHKGITITAPGFYGAQNRSLRLPYRIALPFDSLHQFEWQNTPITNLEMETACIYAFANLLGHQALSFNCILANRLDGSFSASPEESIDRLIRRTLDTVVQASGD